MPKKKSWMQSLHQAIDNQQWLKSLILLGIRLYLLPLFFLAGWQQLNNFEQTVIFFGDILHLPYPYYLAITVIVTEIVTSGTLLIGLFTRWSALILSIMMMVIIFAVQWDNGWHYVLEYNASIDSIITLVQQYGNYDELTQQGDIVILNNGIELSVIYALMLWVLFSYGGGKLSVDARLWDK